MHDYPDEKCVEILRNIIPAMDTYSNILIDELVLPNSGVRWQVTQMDLAMMCNLGSLERTKDQWYGLMDRAGLEILAIHNYHPWMHNSVIVAAPK